MADNLKKKILVKFKINYIFSSNNQANFLCWVYLHNALGIKLGFVFGKFIWKWCVLCVTETLINLINNNNLQFSIWNSDAFRIIISFEDRRRTWPKLWLSESGQNLLNGFLMIFWWKRRTNAVYAIDWHYLSFFY